MLGFLVRSLQTIIIITVVMSMVALAAAVAYMEHDLFVQYLFTLLLFFFRSVLSVDVGSVNGKRWSNGIRERTDQRTGVHIHAPNALFLFCVLSH